MAKVWKDLWHTGTLHLGDGRIVTYTAADIRNGERQGNAMLAAGLRVPMCWEHDPEADPVNLSHTQTPHDTAWLAKGYLGEATQFEARDGALWGLLDIPDDADVQQFKKLRTVSPKLNYEFKDETGKVWPGLTVGHVAATAVPVQRRQYPVNLSRNAHPHSRDAHYLSFAAPAGASTVDPLQRIVTALATLGVQVGDATSLEDLATNLDAMASANPADPKVQDGEPPAGVQAGPSMPPHILSHAALSMPPAMMSRFAGQVARDKADLGKRVEALFTTARIDGPTRQHLDGTLKATNLSHTSYKPDGSFQPLRVLAEIEAYERLPQGRFAPEHNRAADLSHAKPVERPENAMSGATEAAAQMRKLAEDK